MRNLLVHLKAKTSLSFADRHHNQCLNKRSFIETVLPGKG